MNGYAPSAQGERVLAWLRKGTRYDELRGTCAFDGAIREADLAERQTARLVDLARRSFRKMSVACRAGRNPLSGDARSSKKPIVELAAHFGLLPKRPKSSGLVAHGRTYQKSDEELAHDLINPLLYFDKAASALKQGFVRARLGKELTTDDAVAMFENYLGVTRRKEEIVAEVPSRFMLELTGASSGDMRLSDHAARSMI